MRILTGALFREILIRPTAVGGADELTILSGYVTAGMLERHVEELKKGVSEERIGQLPRIEIVVGMASHGIEIVQHRGLCDMVRRFQGMINCSYLVRGNPCHSKVFVWKRKGVPVRAFVGSANYTISGFGSSQREAVAEADPYIANQYCETLIRQSMPCTAPETETLVKLMETRDVTEFADEDSVILSLLITRGKRKGDTHHKGGLNWGQRDRRNPDEAYIPIPKAVRDSSFFPPREQRFTALTDDGQSLILVVAQQDGKALHTTMDNSELGRYFRARIGVPKGEFVTRQHLLNYGRTNVGFYRIDPETYQMDFRPNLGPTETLERLEP